MKTSNNKKAYAFQGAAALITAALLAVSLLFTACPNSAGGGGGGPIKVLFNSSVSVYKHANKVQSGDSLYAGQQLQFIAPTLTGNLQVDKWKVNTKELDGNNYTVFVGDAVDAGTDKVITVTYTTKAAAAVKIKFDQGISVYKSDFSTVANGSSSVYEGNQLRFIAPAIPAGLKVDKWKVNTKELHYNGYMVNAADAVDEGTDKVITVTYTLR